MPDPKALQRIREQNARLRLLLAAHDLEQRPVPNSSWSAIDHIDHTVKVASSILHLLAKPEIPAAPRGISLLGRMVLWIGWIPRGRGKSPERLRPTPTTLDELKARLTEVDQLIESVATRPGALPSFPIVRHPVFGGLTYAQSLRFVAIHTHHHLKILDGALMASVKKA